MNDRMAQLQNMNNGGGDIEANVIARGTYQGSTQGLNEGRGTYGGQSLGGQSVGQEALMPEFTSKVNEAKKILGRIQANNDEIKDLKDQNQRAINSANEKEINQELNIVLAESNKLNQQLKSVMEQISDDVNEAKRNQPDDAETSMKENALAALVDKVQTVLENSQSAQEQYKDGIKQKITRQVKYLDADLTQNQIDEMVEDPQKYNDLLQEKTVGSASIQLRNAVSDIQDKCRDIKKLQQNVEIVHQMFLDMALLVQQQGQKLNDIEMNVKSANKNITKAEKNLQKAKTEHQQGRKKMCCIIMGGLIILLIIVIPVLTTA